MPSVVCPFLIPTFLHPSRQKFSNDRCGGGGRCVIQAITLSSCQEEKNGRDLMRVAAGGFDRRLITAGLCFFFGGGAGRGGGALRGGVVVVGGSISLLVF